MLLNIITTIVFLYLVGSYGMVSYLYLFDEETKKELVISSTFEKISVFILFPALLLRSVLYLAFYKGKPHD